MLFLMSVFIAPYLSPTHHDPTRLASNVAELVKVDLQNNRIF